MVVIQATYPGVRGFWTGLLGTPSTNAQRPRNRMETGALFALHGAHAPGHRPRGTGGCNIELSGFFWL